MSRNRVSVVMCTYQRGELLRRSLIGYERSEGLDPVRDLQLVVVDDGSTDGTGDIVRDWSHRTGIGAVVLTPHPKRESWRDCAATLNHGIRASTGNVVILTHPEVIPGRRSVAACAEALERTPWLYACCAVYYLSPADQVQIDSVPWADEGALAVRKIPGFYTDDTNGHPDYRHAVTDTVGKPGSRITGWESWVWGGCHRDTWRRLGGMLETKRWGGVDVAFTHRRRTLGIGNYTCPDDDTRVVHQNHDLPGNIPTDRNMQAWVDELRPMDLNNPSKLVWPEVDFLGWSG